MADVAPGLQGVRAEALQVAPFGRWSLAIQIRLPRGRACAIALLLTAGFGPLAARQQPTDAKGPAFVDITWIAIPHAHANEALMFPFLMDGYITRIPQGAFSGGGGGLAQTRQV